MTTYRLEELSVDKVAFVPEGDNKGAHILLFKSKAKPNHEEKTPEKGVSNVKIDKSKMTPEEQDILAEFEKKYGVAEETGPEAEQENGVEKGGKLHPDVEKALASFQEITRKQAAEVEELKKSLEIERLTAASQKYEILGKKAPELAEKLYALKKAGGTVYADYVALLDESLAALNKSGLFREIGSNRQGSAGTVQTLSIKAQELQKSAVGKMTASEAIIKAWEENPELAAQYEAEYQGR